MRVVIKFGGTSVGSVERIQNIAKRIRILKTGGHDVVVVVSAMSGETDRLINLGRSILSSNKALENKMQREFDQLISTGEQITAALSAIALEKEGIKSLSMTGFQAGIETEHLFGQNLIRKIESRKILNVLSEGFVPVVTGFQGVDSFNNITTLGRGGSDTTAVAIAAALDSCRCDIMTDVDGVYTALPSLVKSARRLKYLTYEEMLELASSGAKVLATRSVSLAKKFLVPLYVKSTFRDENDEGTQIVENYLGMEDAIVSGITARADQTKLTLKNLPDKPGYAAKVLKCLGDANVNVDMIIQSGGSGGLAQMSLTIPTESSEVAVDCLGTMLRENSLDSSIELNKRISKLSVVGEGMRNHPGVASRIFDVLGREGINVELISTSEIKVSVAIDEKYAELAVRALHEEFIDKAESC